MSDATDDTILPSTVGTSGANMTFQVDGITYQASSGANDGGTWSLLDAKQLITSGQATPVAPNYLAQFPWTTPPA